jgi:hypothetical protein
MSLDQFAQRRRRQGSQLLPGRAGSDDIATRTFTIITTDANAPIAELHIECL